MPSLSLGLIISLIWADGLNNRAVKRPYVGLLYSDAVQKLGSISCTD